ncbi:MAG: hypothetical protein JNM00_07690, partial [Flavobacteriales bacterium]|nr:hypothetical protein [Flavobacteriales bacterium]
MKHIVVLALMGCFHIHMPAQINMELVGVSTDASPWFRYVDNFNMYDDVFVAIDPLLNPEIEAMEVEIFVVLDKNESQWDGDPMLTDVTPGGQASFLFSGAGIQDNVFYLTESYTLFDNFSPLVGDAYDIVVDMNGDGLLSPGDFIDGLQDVGMYVIQDITMPGPYAVVTADETSSDYLTKRIWYPENIEELDDLPLVVISHGWTHEYTYYDYLGTHMASYGYIVMAHRNDVGMGNAAGTQSASLSLIANVDDLIANQSTLFGGVLNGKMD